MNSKVKIKICGLKTAQSIHAAQGAEYNGFVFFPLSPRYITISEAVLLKSHITHSKTVAVTVDPDNRFLSELIPSFAPDYIQLHGNETPERICEIREKFNIPIIKALRIKNAHDLKLAKEFEPYADMLLFDAKVENGLPGGTGQSFDWTLLANETFTLPWFLSGGISIENAKQALHISHARLLDVSSALETAPGEKSFKKITEFLKYISTISLTVS